MALFVAIAVAFFSTSARLEGAQAFINHSKEVRAALDSIQSYLVQADLAVRHYQHTRTESFRKKYAGALAGLQQANKNLDELTTDNEQRQSVTHILRLTDLHIALMNEALGAPAGTAEDTGHIKEIQGVIDQLRSEQEREIAARSQSASTTAYVSRRVIAGATLVGFLLVIVSTVAIRRDMHLREQSELALRTAEQKLRSFFENAPIGIFESTPDGRLLSANQTIASILGYDSPEDLIYHRNELKKPLYVDPAVRDVLVKVLTEKGVIHDYECLWYRKDGSTIWITGNGKLVRDGTYEHFEAMLYDISKRKHAEEQLANVKSQLENVLNSATGVSIICTDVQGKITIFNPGAERMLGYTAAEMIGRGPEAFHHEPEVTERCRELSTKLGGRRVNRFDVFVENVRKGGHEIREWTYVRKDGHHVAVSLTVTGLRNPKNELIGFLGIGTDITDRKQAERDRVRLEQQLRRKNLELERETQRALEASRMKSEFLANMSHELRTPLNGIIGFAEMIHDEVVGPVSEEQRDYLGDILTSARHLLQLINDVLDLSKVEAGKMEFQPEDIELKKLIEEVQAILKSISDKKHLQIVTDLDPRLTEVYLDPRKLKQVLYNYISNAIKFTPEGGNIYIRTRFEGEDMFRVEVEDTGIGIKKESLDQLFIEFHQLDASASKRYQGTGLGLALTKRIAEVQGGRVGVESTWGKGSIFYAVLPITGATILASPSAEETNEREISMSLVPEAHGQATDLNS